MDPLQLTPVVLVAMAAILAYSSWTTSGRRHVAARDWGWGFLMFGVAMGLALTRQVVEDHRVLSALAGLFIVLGGWFHYSGFATILHTTTPRWLRGLLASSVLVMIVSGSLLVAFETRAVSRILENGFNSLFLVLIIVSLVRAKVQFHRSQKVLLSLLLGSLVPLYGGSTLGSVATLFNLPGFEGWENPFQVLGTVEWIVALCLLATCENLLLVGIVSQEHGASLIQSARNSDHFRLVNQELGQYQKDILHTMIRVLEASSGSPGPDRHRVAALTQAILRTLGYSEEYSRLVGLASILHVFASPLGREECLGPSDLPIYQLARRIAQELEIPWVDGAVSLEARVVAVAVAYQALDREDDGPRPSHETICDALLGEPERPFDPEVVQACRQCSWGNHHRPEPAVE